MSCCPWAAGDQQGGRQGSRLPQGTICYRERHYELLPVGCWRPAGGRQGSESRLIINDPRNSATMSCHPWATA